MAKKDTTYVSTFTKLKGINAILSYYSSIYCIKQTGFVTCKSLLDGVEYVGILTNPDILLFVNSVVLPNKFAEALNKAKVEELAITKDDVNGKFSFIKSGENALTVPLLRNNNDLGEFYKVFPMYFDNLLKYDYIQIDENTVKDIVEGNLVTYQNHDIYIRMTRQLFPAIRKDSELFVYKIPDYRDNGKTRLIFKLCLKNIEMYTLCSTLLN